MTGDCVFCGIVEGTAPRHEIVAETLGALAFMNANPAGWQSVFHFHVHVVPRWTGDALIPNWTEPLGDRTAIPMAAHQLREAFL
jgi:diadenosine tetraphosphate (Ap4A) HIT family hydrolase